MTDVDTCSEDYRELCEARYVINLRNKDARNSYIRRVREVRGNAMADKLAARVEKLWKERKIDNGKRTR